MTSYEYSVGTSAGSEDVMPWANAGTSTSMSISSLGLVEGQTYYVTLRARMPSGELSDPITSSGWTVDLTPPSAPGALEDGILQPLLSETNTMSWTASSDSLSGVSFYEVAIGTSAGSDNTLTWTSVGNVTSHKITSLSLVSGTTYYASIRAVDRAGNRGAETQSDGWLAGPYCSNKTSWLVYNSSGLGTQADPYLICNAFQLASIGATPAALSAVYKLMGDIDLAPYYAAPNPQFRIGTCGAGGCAVWDTGAFLFSGTFDGNGHTISNFSFSSPGTRGIGFISGTWGRALIRNLNLTNVNVSGGSQTGGLIGSSQFAAVHNSHVSGTVTGDGAGVGGLTGTSYHLVMGNSSFNGSVTSTSSGVGGIVGQLEESSLFSSKSSGSVSSTQHRVGGLAGFMSGRSPSRISNSYSTSSVSGSTEVGGIIGELSVDRGIIQKSYSAGSVTGSGSRVGGITGRSVSNTEIKDSYSVSSVSGTAGSGSIGYLVGDLSGTITNSYYFSGSTCDSTGSGGACGTAGLSHASLTTFFDKAQAPISSWDDLSTAGDGTDNFWSFNGTEHAKIWLETENPVVSEFTSGTGHMTDPYLISTVEQFKKIGQNPRYMTASFRLTNPMNFWEGGFKQIGGSQAPYSGHFFGNGKLIINLSNLQPSEDAVGVFGMVATGGRIENLNISNAVISGRSDVGGAVGILDAADFTGITITSGSVTSNGSFSGGAIGRFAKTDVIQVGVNTSINGQNFVGGFVGEIYSGSVRECFAKGTVNGVDNVGGISGKLMAGGIYNSYATADVTSSGSGVGGISGQSGWGGVYDSYSTGNVNGVSFVGGGFGDAGNITIQNVFVTGSVLGANGSTEVGYLLGTSSTPTITNSHYWSGASCDSTGASGACNTAATSGIANVADFQNSSNAPLSSWDFSTIWQVVPSQFPALSFD